MKQEFEMLQQEMDDIIEINKEGGEPVMKFGDHWSGMSVQEKVNNYWGKLADKYGFKQMTVEGSSKGKLFFLAEPRLVEPLKTSEELAIEKYDTLQKIVDQLESCDYESIGGSLKNNVAFIRLRQMAELT